MSPIITTASHGLVEENSNLYIFMSATSMVLSSRLSLPFKLLLTTNSHLIYVVRHVESIENSHVNHHNRSISYPIKINLKDP